MTQNTKDRVREAAVAYLSGVRMDELERIHYLDVLDSSTDPAAYSEYFESLHGSNIATIWALLAKDEESHADLIAKLDGIIFDPAQPTPVRSAASDVVGLLADGNPMARVRYAMGQQAGTETLNGIVEIRELLREYGF